MRVFLTWLNCCALKKLYPAVVHDLPHTDAEDLDIVVLCIDARFLHQLDCSVNFC